MNGPRHPFAPGTIDAQVRRCSAWQWLLRAGLALVGSALAGLVLGYASGRGWL